MWTIRIRRAAVGLLAVGLLAAAGCGDDSGNGGSGDPGTATDQATPTPTPTPAASPSPSEVDEVIEIEITDGEVDPPVGRVTVEQDATVRLVVTSDQPDEIHLHGYDLTAAVGPDSEGTIEFEAGQTGLFELETHESGLVLLQLLVE